MLDFAFRSFHLLFVMPIAYAIGSVLIDRFLKPLLIPDAEIEAAAKDLIRRFEDPVGAAMIEEHAAWYRSDNLSQGRWRRVRRRISRLLKHGSSGQARG